MTGSKQPSYISLHQHQAGLSRKYDGGPIRSERPVCIRDRLGGLNDRFGEKALHRRDGFCDLTPKSSRMLLQQHQAARL
jgi:hypothetical protein